MQITKHKVVTMDYTLTDPEGTVIDTSKGASAFSFIHGIGGIIPGLENALEGKIAGESLEVTVSPEEGYGERNEDMTQQVPKDRFEDVQDIQAGMQFQTMTEAGPQIVTVVDVDDSFVTVDANHPLAGVTLKFEVDIIGVRDATQEEIDHGHVHGEGGHHHHD